VTSTDATSRSAATATLTAAPAHATTTAPADTDTTAPATTAAPADPTPSGATPAPESDELHLIIGRQLGQFMRRSDRFYTEVKFGGLELERSAFLLLGRINVGGPARLSRLAEDSCLEPSTISRQVAALEAAGLVARTTDTSDRRASVIAATPEGERVYLRSKEVWLGALRDLLADWTPAERSEFARLFTKFNDAIAAQSHARAPGTHLATGRDAAGTNHVAGPAGSAAIPGGAGQESTS
jgi:DNA-binding MarR family transcriptional regulator